MRPEYKKSNILTSLRPVMAFALIAGGLGQAIAPVFAEGTAAGVDISNTATASYEDPNNANVPIETVSNTVKVSVAKVAGITITTNGYEDLGPTGNGSNAGNYVAGDVVAFKYKVTNTGNATVKFNIPSVATVSSNATFDKVQYKNASGDWTTVAAGTSYTTDAISVDTFQEVRVLAKINTGVTTGKIEVILGKTKGVTGAPTKDQDNVERVAPQGSEAEDVFTSDITNDTAVAPIGNAVNGVREAAKTNSVDVNATKEAFANITMTGGTPVPGTPADDLSKNKITYDIKVKVDDIAPTGSTSAPADLAPTPVKIDTAGNINIQNHVLISNPVPANTTATKVTVPDTNWTGVYSTSPVGTPQADIIWVAVDADGSVPTGTRVNFVGFIRTVDTVLAKSSTEYTGFQVELETTGVDPVAGGSVSNTAYVYGTTPTADGTTPDIAKPVSDQTGTTAANTPSGGTPVVTPLTPVGSIFNGPKNQPEAAGPQSNQNTDYTNKSVQITTADLGTGPDADGNLPNLTRVVTASFENTIISKADAVVYLLPDVVTDNNLPTGSLVRISYGAESITYQYTIANGTGSFTPLTADATKAPIKLTLVKDVTDSYGVQVTLPSSGTKQLTGYAAPITAFSVTTGNAPAAGVSAVPTTNVVKKNTTIDRVYTGYLKLIKESRVLKLNDAGDAKVEVVAFSQTDKTVRPGQFIEYRIKYENISIGGGSNSVDLNAGKVKLKEDGTIAGRWGSNTTHDAGSAANLLDGVTAGTINYSPSGTNNTTPGVTMYELDLGASTVTPGKSGSFSFIRKVNDTGATPVNTSTSSNAQ